MSKKINRSFDFNIIRYKELLNLAKGDRSQAKFAADCQLSAAYIGKQLNQPSPVAPIPSTLKKIAGASADATVTYDELLRAVGYDPAKYAISATENKNQEHTASFKMLASSAIIRGFYNSITENKHFVSLNSTDDMYLIVTVSTDDLIQKKWYMHLLADAGTIDNESMDDYITKCWGHVALFGDNCYKYSFVTDSVEIYDRMVSKSAPAVSFPVSVILIDLKENAVLKEDPIATGADNMQILFSLKPNDRETFKRLLAYTKALNSTKNKKERL